MSKLRTLQDYKPVINPLNNHGVFFETYGAELSLVRMQWAQDKTKVWTVVDCDGESCTMAGLHSVNRLGYIVTEQSWESSDIVFGEDGKRLGR